MAYDPEYQQAAARTFEKLGIPSDRPTPRYPKGDIATRRKGGTAFLEAALALQHRDYPNIEKTEYKILGYEQVELSLFAFREKGTRKSLPEPAVLYIHGGGMFFGSPMLFETVTKTDVAATGVAHFSIQYRYAPEFPHPVPVEDCYAALVWLSTHAQELQIDPKRLAVAGLSAGGGIAAGVALIARDRRLHPPLAKQILLTPMLDDRNTVTDSSLLPLVTWSWDDSWTGWNALLRDEAGSDSVSQYAAPARARDLRDLPATFIDVGTLDIFFDESRVYAEKLEAAGVDVEYQLYQGVPHGFEFRGAGTDVLNQALARRYATIKSL